MKKTLLYIFAAALASLLTLQSCGLEEPFHGPQNGITEGTVEFVARPASYNNHNVTTKADGGFDDAAIHNAFIILFNADGKRILFEEINIAKGQFSVKIDRSLGNVTACVLANVPKNFAEEIIGLTNLNPGTNDNQYINTAVIDIPEYQSGTPMGVPKIDHDNDPNTASKACIPMFGQSSGPIDLSNYTTPYQIEVKRLFAKVTVNLTLQLTGLTDYESAIQALTHYQVNTVKLYNLPQRVNLVESNSESPWYNIKGMYSETPMQVSANSTKVYNNIEGQLLNTIYTCSCYVPEFYLSPKSPVTDDQRFKPKNYPDNTFPIYIQLEGRYNKYSISSADINYKVYLGGDPIDDFSLARNTHYINDLTIQNTNNNDADQTNIDHRVSTITINNPVAKAGKAANCYVISQPGDYRFPAYMGAYNDLTDAVSCEGGVDVEILVNNAQYEGYSDITSINISSESYDPVTNMISFSVASAPIINVVPNGNVVIALVDKEKTDASRKIIWSWHLWFYSDFSGGNESDWATIGTQTYPNNKQMMDRNLGAYMETSSISEGLGLYYRYNDKNPYIGSAYIGGGVNGTATFDPANDSNTNDNTKAVHDPCPPGYRVPEVSEWPSATPKHVNLDFTGLFGSTGVMLFYDQQNLSNDVYYPYSGYRSGTQVQYKIQEDREYTTPSSYTVTDSDKDVQIKSGTGWRDKEQTGIRTTTTTTYYHYVYTVPIASTFGYLLGQDKALYYENTEDKIDLAYTNMHVLSCKARDHVKVENVKRSRRLITTSWDLISWETVNTISEGYGDEYTVTSHSSFTLNQAAINRTEEKDKISSTSATPNSSYGYQIRCIKE